ncbi:MAG: hypothetical protein M2R45_03118 [Verrucomicrobia subdivision 3 bacterium]|nr:hypothetical protein [Limisphaerales bacterium]MCS1413186.1 hypothetical protein [Limisphaerales bacterium]
MRERTFLLNRLRDDEMTSRSCVRPAQILRYVRIIHRFLDSFTVIADEALASQYSRFSGRQSVARLRWLKSQNWLLMTPDSYTGIQLQA